MATPAPTSLAARQNQASTSQLIIPSSAPAGLLTITQPPQTATSYYKIAPGSPITFAWNFSYVLATPTHLTVSAACDNGNTYPVGPGTLAGSATSVVWDVYSYNEANPATPLAQATYTLLVWGDQGPNAPRLPGYLQENSELQFALYSPQPYTPIASGWQCPSCSGSLAAVAANPAAVGILSTLIIIFLSGFSLLRVGGR